MVHPSEVDNKNNINLRKGEDKMHQAITPDYVVTLVTYLCQQDTCDP